MKYDTLVVGAGFAGSVIAERLASGGQKVLVIDKRPYVGGSAHDYVDEAGVRVHAHGAHVFHTNSARVANYLSHFTAWRPYEHRVLADVGGRYVPMPINRTTVNLLFALDLQTEAEVERFFEAERDDVPSGGVKTSEQQVTTRVGRRLYDLLYRDYTRKHWRCDASELHACVAGRLPFRTNDDSRYFTDRFQAMPAQGFTALFERLLAGVDVELGCEWEDGAVACKRVVFTGPIDEFFDYCFGYLPFRSVRFEHHSSSSPDLELPAGVVNCPGPDVPYTRIIEYRHITGQDLGATSVHYEFPTDNGDPYYPVPGEENWSLYRAYRKLAEAEAPHVTFAGRLGRYQYLTMDQVIAQALRIARTLRLEY